MAQFEMKTIDGLKTACQEAERQLKQKTAEVETNARFLQRVQEASDDERATQDFMRLLWVDNSLYRLSNERAMNASIAIYGSTFPRPFLELIDAPLPEDVQERARELDVRMDKARGLAWPSNPIGSTVGTTRTFATLFPHDFTTHRSPGRQGRLFQVLSGDKNVRDEAWVNRWLLDRVDEAVGPVDRSDWNAVARRMMLPEILFEIATKEERRTSRPEDRLPLSPTWEIHERWCFVALARQLREWLPDYEWKTAGRSDSDRRRFTGTRGDGHRITLHLQRTFGNSRGRERDESWSISREFRPDLVLTSLSSDGLLRFVVLDAKYRAAEAGILNGMTESVHPYADALRWGPHRSERTLLLVPNAAEAQWLTLADYVENHNVGVVALRPDIEVPEWFRELLTDDVMTMPGQKPRAGSQGKVTADRVRS